MLIGECYLPKAVFKGVYCMIAATVSSMKGCRKWPACTDGLYPEGSVESAAAAMPMHVPACWPMMGLQCTTARMSGPANRSCCTKHSASPLWRAPSRCTHSRNTDTLPQPYAHRVSTPPFSSLPQTCQAKC